MSNSDAGTPPTVYRARIRSEWIDRNGHFNAGWYMVLFDDAIGSWHDLYGLDSGYRARHPVSTFTVESHTTYLRELLEGEEITITGQLLGYDEKRVHTFLRMFRERDGLLAATNEVLSLHMDMANRRVAAMAPELLAGLERLAEEHLGMERPSQANRIISIDVEPPARS